jgi:hypothetical protein
VSIETVVRGLRDQTDCRGCLLHKPGFTTRGLRERGRVLLCRQLHISAAASIVNSFFVIARRELYTNPNLFCHRA